MKPINLGDVLNVKPDKVKPNQSRSFAQHFEMNPPGCPSGTTVCITNQSPEFFALGVFFFPASIQTFCIGKQSACLSIILEEFPITSEL